MPLLPEKAPGETAITRIWESVEKGIGKLATPWQIRREGRARNDIRRDELLVLAQTEEDIADIRAGRKIFNEKRQLISTSERQEPTLLPPSSNQITERKEPILYLPPAGSKDGAEHLNEWVDQVRDENDLRAAQRRVNLMRTILQAEELAEEATDSEATDKQIHPDWFERWRSGAEAVTDKDVQALWAAVLAGEAVRPGKFSLRTLAFLQNISKTDAELINKIGPLIINGRLIYKDDALFYSLGIDLAAWLALDELGIVKGRESIGGLSFTFKTYSSTNFETQLHIGKKVLIADAEDKNLALTIPIYHLTKIGMEILSLGSFDSNELYLNSVVSSLKQQGFRVRVGDVSADLKEVINIIEI